MIDEKFKEHAVGRQLEIIDAINTHGSHRKAAEALGIHHSQVDKAVKAVRERAAKAGYAPEADLTHGVAPGFKVKRISTNYRDDGSIGQQWVIQNPDAEAAMRALEEFIGWLTKDAHGRSPVVHAPKNTTSDLLALYPMGDPHFGMMSWARETGANFDLEIAEELTRAAIDRLVEAAPPADTAIILELGDFFHADDSTNRTPHGQNQLDVDGRFAKIQQIGLRAMCYVVTKALERHKKVVVRIVKGNHDPHASTGLALAIDAFFANNPRVEVQLSPAPFWYYRFGENLIGATHGDTCKPGDLLGVMVTDQKSNWGKTSFHYWYAGHVHHSKVLEFPGMVVEYFRTLASGDAWHNAKGYRSGRDMRCIVLHKEFGEIERHRCDIAMLQRQKSKAVSPES